MANMFEKLMARKKKERELNLHQSQIGRVGGMLATPYRDLAKQYEYELERGGAPLATKMDYALKTQQQLGGMLGGQYERAVTRDVERKGALTGQISELEFKSDIYKEQKKKEKEAREKAEGRQWWQVGAQVAGAGAGFVVGGLPGAQLGSAIGGGVGNVIDAGLPQDPAGLLQATGDVLSVISTESGLKTVEKRMTELSGEIGKLESIRLSDPKQFNFKLQTLLGLVRTGGDINMYNEMLREAGLFGEQTQPYYQSGLDLKLYS